MKQHYLIQIIRVPDPEDPDQNQYSIQKIVSQSELDITLYANPASLIAKVAKAAYGELIGHLAKAAAENS